MTNTTKRVFMLVTPQKMEADRKVQDVRVADRALSLEPSNVPQQRQAQDLNNSIIGMALEQKQTSSSVTKTRVFRCLSNTAAGMQSPTRSPSQAQQSDLKSMFQPPASSTSRHTPRSPRQQQEQVRTAQHAAIQTMSFFGCHLDRSSVSIRQLRSSSAENTNDGHKKVHFRQTVMVVRIPSHRDYPSTVKMTLWGSMKEIKANAIRNTAEFIFDKCNWRQSKEENQFYRDTRNGSLIHPVHVQRYYAALQRVKEEQIKKQRQHEQSENNGEDQHQQPEKRKLIIREEQSRSSQKRVRCCSPSPVHRSHADYIEEEREAKRSRRLIQVPMPQCRQPIYYSPTPTHTPMYALCPAQLQQENSYAYYENQPMAVMNPYPFRQHPSQPFTPAEIA